jgi:hypothetical protein
LDGGTGWKKGIKVEDGRRKERKEKKLHDPRL